MTHLRCFSKQEFAELLEVLMAQGSPSAGINSYLLNQHTHIGMPLPVIAGSVTLEELQ